MSKMYGRKELKKTIKVLFCKMLVSQKKRDKHKPFRCHIPEV